MLLFLKPPSSCNRLRVDYAPHTIIGGSPIDNAIGLEMCCISDVLTYLDDFFHVSTHILETFALFGQTCEVNVLSD
jgi:hypothetical protein